MILFKFHKKKKSLTRYGFVKSFQLLFNNREFTYKAFVVFVISFLSVLPIQVNGQILLMEDCFKGGVTSGGVNNIGAGFNYTCKIKWEDDFTLRAAYALTYRYGRPEPHAMKVNGSEVLWSMQSQLGPEQIETNSESDFFASHAKDITNIVQITSDTLRIDFPEQKFYDIQGWNWGWWGVYVVILYESPSITTNVCSRIYIANESQVIPQSYHFETPQLKLATPILFSIFSSRLSGFSIDSSVVSINSLLVGTINGPDSTLPEPPGGVQGHFYYQDESAVGLNGDHANNYVYGQDGVAVINNYINWNSPSQHLDRSHQTR